MYKRYEGSFAGREGTLWTAEIWQDADTAYATTEQLSFSGEEPLTIEWDEAAKEDVICGSTATLHIISPGDRTYIDLYTITPGKIRLDVRKDGTLYWSGTLDPEFYEEPYTDNEDYEVSFTFSDFGILDRLKWNQSGLLTLEAIITTALQRSAINYTEINQDYISTQLTADSGKMTLKELSVRSDNFYDEDNEASTLKEVAEGILQPLALKITQRNGKIWIYDLNGLYGNAGTEKIIWKDDGQTMGTDKVSNDVQITFSPYSNAKQSTDATYTGESDIDDEDSNADPIVKNYNEGSSYNMDKDAAWDWKGISFKVFCSNKGKGLEEISTAAKYFKIMPVLGGEEAEGVAYGFKHITGWIGSTSGNGTAHYETVLTEPSKITTDTGMIMRTHKIYLPKLADSSKYLINIKLAMLADARYNPYTTDEDVENETDDYNEVKSTFTMASMNATVRMLDDSGKTTAAYYNTAVTFEDSNKNMFPSGQGWLTTDPDNAICKLGYYDKSDLVEGCAICGWQTNRHWTGFCTGGTEGEITNSQLKAAGDGQYIPYPPTGGWLEVRILGGMDAINWTHHGDNRYTTIDDEDWARLRWLLLKAPEVTIVRNNAKMSEVESDDIEYKGTVNADAKDDIDIDTTCGTMKAVCPTAKGAYYKTSDAEQIMTLYRNGQTNQAERLLIGTLYSQYADRKTKLSGVTELLTGDLKTYSDGAQADGVKFALTSDYEDLGEETSEMNIVELEADGWSPDEE